MKHRRRRIITRVVVFLIGGAILNIAVAWGCGYYLEPDIMGSEGKPLRITQRLSREHGLWIRGDGVRITGAVKWLLETTADDLSAQSDLSPLGRPFDTLPSWTVDVVRGGIGESPETNAIVVEGRGWPLLSLAASADPYGAKVLVGLPIRPETESAENAFLTNFALPTKPIWPGFAINTIFYAAVLWLLFAAPGVIRKRRRIKRGLCPACAYPVGESEVCTECGARVKGAST